MAKVKSIITEADVMFMKDVEIEYVSLVGHAANRQPFKIIKGEVKGDNAMPKTIYNVLVSKDVTEEKLQEIMLEHNFSIETKAEDALEGYIVYNQIDEKEVDLETRKMSALADGVYAIVADLKEDSDKEGLEKEEMEYETLEKIADSLFAMMDIVLGTMRQPEAGASRKEMIMTAISNFSNYAGAILSTVKAEDVLGDFEIKSEVVKEFMEQEEIIEFNPEEFEDNLKTELISKFTEMLESQITLVKSEFAETKTALNKSLNEQFELYQKKEDVDQELALVKAEIETIKNTANSRKSELNEDLKKTVKTETKKKQSFTTFV